MAKTHVKRDDTVVVISGASKGKRGRILSVDRKKQRVVVEGVNVRTKTLRRSPEHPQGGITEVETPIHISNVMSAETYDASPQRKKSGGAAAASDETAEQSEES